MATNSQAAAAPAPTPAPTLEEAVRAPLDAAIAQLAIGERTWGAFTVGQRARLLDRVTETVGAHAAEWADVAATAKSLPQGDPLRGEEWLSGPYGTLTALASYANSLRALEAGKSPAGELRIDRAPGGRFRAHVFPTSAVDGMLLSGFTGEVWMRPGVTEAQVRANAGLAQLTPERTGGIGLVLGAGNVTSIPLLDALYELLAFNRVVLLKLNPTQDALLPVFTRAFAPLIELNLVRIVTGAGDVGAYLTAHPGIAHVHITGSAATHDAIVWGVGEEAARRKAAGTPLLQTEISSELGGVSPIIVVPGRWSKADLRFQAEHIATMRLQNSGHNCIAGQVVLLSADWPQKHAFLIELRDAYSRAPQRPVWYPGAERKLEDAAAAYPHAERLGDGSRLLIDLAPGDDASAMEHTEYFAPVLGVVELRGTGQRFVDAAVDHANDRLTGTLGANVLIDPVTQRRLGEGFEAAIERLHYGAIAINTWTAVAFLTSGCTWGAYPGATLENVSSGIGVVHNSFLLDDVERSVVRGPFRPFPRSVSPSSLIAREGSVLPKPPWFVTARTGAQVSAGLTEFQARRNPIGLARTLMAAFRA
ncbi:MAG: aldehyde dehydrogenase family protein [Microbacteriaceae bacterium]|nr:aldehyde dehydrogenase family protein [Microbacteriaceae bacterium]HQC93545.1 aldehyde dehydrogenase family protein [Microbacteriaceae bacterium]